MIKVVKDTFVKTYDILKEKKVNVMNEMTIVIYRNYNCLPSKLLESTPFENDYVKLFEFLSKVKVNGGIKH